MTLEVGVVMSVVVMVAAFILAVVTMGTGHQTGAVTLMVVAILASVATSTFAVAYVLKQIWSVT